MLEFKQVFTNGQNLKILQKFRKKIKHVLWAIPKTFFSVKFFSKINPFHLIN